ncbi:MAG: hypothetical protein J7L82_05610 [Staphylothermus sp.]|nr:hypothetical protein [Staphylothermus sp.]
MPKTDRMTKLSPSEPSFIVRITIETRQDYPLTKIEKLLRKNYRAQTNITSPYTLVAKFVTKFHPNEVYELLNKIAKLWKNLENRITGFCIEPYIVLKNAPLPPNLTEKVIKKTRINNKEIILASINNMLIYVYHNADKRTTSIRLLKNLITMNIDLLQLPKTSYIYCNEELHTIMETMKNFITEASKLLNQ